jgi:hypothetical protein
MSDEPTIYTREELNGLTRVQLRQLAVNTYGMDNTKCAKTKAADLKDWIMEQQEGGGGGNNDSKQTRGGGGRGRPSAAGRKGRPSAAPPAQKGSGRGRGRPAARPEPEPEPEPEPQDDGGADGAEGGAEVDLSGIEERLDALGKAVDESDEELRAHVAEVSEIVADIQRNQFMQFGLLCDIRTSLYGEEDDLDARLDQLESEWEEGQNQGE